MSVRKIQAELAAQGYNVGAIDGIRGRQTILAIKAFQRKNRLFQDGIVGAKTSAKLFGKKVDPIVSAEFPWIDEAKRMRGLHEVRNKRTLMNWLAKDGGTVGDPAVTPWCGDFVQTAIALTMTDEPIPANPYLALNWLKFGKSCKPQFGCILVFWRVSPDSWKGHVGFYVSEDATHYHVLGANQSNAVTITRIAKERLRDDGSRWPLTAMDANGRTRYANANGLITTTNEA